MSETDEIAKPLETWADVLKSLDDRAQSIKKKIDARNILTQKTGEKHTLKRPRDSQDQTVDNPIYLVEIYEYLSGIVEKIKDAKKLVESERKNTDKFVKQYKLQENVAECYSKLESLDLLGLEVAIGKLKELEPNEESNLFFQSCLRKLQSIDMTDQKKERLVKLGNDVTSGSLPLQELEELMMLTSDLRDIPILSQWYQFARFYFLKYVNKEIAYWEWRNSLGNAIQRILFIGSIGERNIDEDDLLESVHQLENGFNETFLSMAIKNDEYLLNQFRKALECIVDLMKKYDKPGWLLARKRRKEWADYFQARFDFLKAFEGISQFG